MLILGLGTNLGDGLNNLRSALQLLQKSSTIAPLQISPVYTSSALLPAYAPAAWNRPYLNVALACETSLSPFETLRQIKQIENIICVNLCTRRAQGPLRGNLRTALIIQEPSHAILRYRF